MIPDFVPVLGYLDDLVLLPIGTTPAIKLVPSPVLAECRIRSQETMQNGKPVGRVAGGAIRCHPAGAGITLYCVDLQGIHGVIVISPNFVRLISS
ncbi:MAG: hypothetical protein A4E62_02771 [Syntrophorhabdus sp. PtaU1.Bin002]|nr:MAG: hypothetical protein A4E62_02771 [Syntrophorhabdus sp. PtaU1.Bin002]